MPIMDRRYEVSYPFDSSAVHTCELGIKTSATGRARFTSVGYYFAVLNKFRVRGTSTFTQIGFFARTQTPGTHSQIRLVAYTKSGTTFTNVLDTDITSLVATTTSDAWQDVDLTSLPASSRRITVTESDDYYVGVVVKYESEIASPPRWHSIYPNTGYDLGFVTTGLSSYSTFTESDGASSATEPVAIVLTFTTAEDKIHVNTSGITGAVGQETAFLLPRPTSGTYSIIMHDVDVATGQAITAYYYSGSGGAIATRNTHTHDSSTNQIAFAGSNAALNAAEAGNKFTHVVNVDLDNNEINLFYCDRGVGQGVGVYDIIWSSHNCKAAGGARGDFYSYSYPNEVLAFSGGAADAAIDSITVSIEPVLYFGDSQSSAGTSGVGDIRPYRLSLYVHDAFTIDREYIHASIPGNRFLSTNSASTAGYLRWKHTTPGSGDLVDMRGVLVCWPSYGINDITAVVTSTDPDTAAQQIETMMADYVTRMSDLISDIRATGNRLLIIGLPVYTSPGTDQHDAAIKRLNEFLEGMASGGTGAWYNPYPLGPGVTDASNAPHYTDSGAQRVAEFAVEAYESNTIYHPDESGSEFYYSYEVP